MKFLPHDPTLTDDENRDAHRITSYQEESITGALATNSKGALIADDMGVGKTLQSVEIALRSGAARVLVVAPKDALGQWGELFSVQSDGRVVARKLDSTAKGRAAFADFLAGEDGFFMANVEWLTKQAFGYRPATIPLGDPHGKPLWKTKKSTGEIVLKKRKEGAIGPAEEPTREAERLNLQTYVGMKALDLFIFDEFHAIQNGTSLQNRAVSTIQADMRVGLSGTWHGNNFKGAHSAARWVWPGEDENGRDYVEMSSHLWEQEWCEMKYACPNCFTGIDENALVLPGTDAPWKRCVKCQKRFTKSGAMRPKTSVVGEKVPGEFVKSLPCYFRRKPFPDAPAPIKIWVDITPEQRAQYAELEEQAVTWVRDHDGIEAPLVADLPIVLRQRLRTATLGEMSGNEDGEIWFADDARSAKLNALRGVLDEFDRQAGKTEPVLIFTDSKRFAKVVTRRMQAAGKRAVEWTGDVKNADRQTIKEQFIAGEHDYIVATISSLAVAVDGLQKRCSKIVWLSRQESEYLNAQATARIWRPGGNREAFQQVDILANDTLDAGTFSRLTETRIRNEKQMTLVAS